MTKEEFVDKLNTLRDFNDCARRIEDAIPYFNTWESFPPMGEVYSRYIDMLAEAVGAPQYNDESIGLLNDIEWFVYEYDFGRDYHDEVTDENGNVIDFRTPESLYDYITGSKEKENEKSCKN